VTIRFRFLSVLMMIVALTGCASTPASLSFNTKTAKEGLTTVERQLSMARLGERHGQSDTALKIYEKVLVEDSNNVEALHRLGVMAAKKQNYDDAISYLTKAEINDPSNVELLNDLGYALFLTDDLAAAEEKLRRAVQLEPGHRAARNNLGLVLGNAGRWDECLVQFRHAVSEAEAHANLAFVQVQMGELALAEESFLSSLDLDADLDAAAEGLVQIKAKKDMLERRFIADYEAESRTREHIASNIEPAPTSARSLPVSQASRVSVVAAQPQPVIEVPISDRPNIVQVTATQEIAPEPIPVKVATSPLPQRPTSPTRQTAQPVEMKRSELPVPVVIAPPVPVQRPVQIEETARVESQLAVQQASNVQKPQSTEEPVIIEEPLAIEKPIAVESPIATESPTAIEKRTVALQPVIIESPVAIEKTIAGEKPAIFETPSMNDESLRREQSQVARQSPSNSAAKNPLQPTPVSNVESDLKPVQVKNVAKSNTASSPVSIQPVVVKPAEGPKAVPTQSVPIISAAQPSQPYTHIQPASVRSISVSSVEIQKVNVAPVNVKPLSIKTPESLRPATIMPATIMPATPQLDLSKSNDPSSKPATKTSIWD
jgi:Tfp pilus assembly protein PilF